MSDRSKWIVSGSLLILAGVLLALAIWGGPENVPAFVAGLENSNFTVRSQCIRALGKIADPRAIDPLLKRLPNFVIHFRLS